MHGAGTIFFPMLSTGEYLMSKNVKSPSSTKAPSTKSVPTFDHAARKDRGTAITGDRTQKGYTVQSLLPPPTKPRKK
jgi:hypothetical protein